MIPILRIIHYIFKKHNETITEESLDSFFDNGIAFPHFIELIFDEKIPGITDNPVDEMQIKSNNDIALQFLLINNEEIAQASPTYNTEEDRISLLTLILTKQYFKIDEEDIMKKCNQNLEYIYYTNFHDMVGVNCILYLLNALTDGKVQTNTNSEDFNEIMINKFQEAQAPLVIDETSLEPKNQFTFFIQILILFEFFSNNNNTDNQIDTEPQNETTTETQEVKQNEKPMFGDETILKDSDDQDSSDSKDEYVDDFEKEKLSDQALLIAINSIGSKEKINFESLSTTIEINQIIKFTSIFFKEENDSKFLSNLNDQNKPFNEKFRELIKFLGKKEPIFNYLIFNFDDPKLKRKSMSLFSQNFWITFS